MEKKKVLDKAILGTHLNYPDRNLGIYFTVAINNYINGLKNKRLDYSFFIKILSRNIYGINIRKDLVNYLNETKEDLVLSFLDILYDYASIKLTDSNTSTSDLILLNNYAQHVYDFTKAKSLTSLKNEIYNNPIILEKCLIENLKDAINLYVKDLKLEDVFELDTIKNEEYFEESKNVLTNLEQFELKPSFYGSLLDGDIQVESQKGYKSRKNAIQQDAVLSVVKNSNCYLNVVADGAGGSSHGEKASIEIISRLKNWFNNLSLDILDGNHNILLQGLINRELVKINNYLTEKYEHSVSTVVLALTMNDYTIIANVGDSTAYMYDENSDKLIELSVLDSLSYGLSYEEARRNINNNKITAAIGSINHDFEEEIAHFMLIKNNNQKLILSSDGVTDLVSEERFKSYFKKDSTAFEIVYDAINTPDVENIRKKEDNVSAIVIKLPKSLEVKRKILNAK